METIEEQYKSENEMEKDQEANTETITAEDVECDIDLLNQVAEQEESTETTYGEPLYEDAFKLTPEMIKMIQRLMKGKPNRRTKRKITPSMRKAKRTSQKKARRKNR